MSAATVRTIYVEVIDRKTGIPIKGVRLARIAAAVCEQMPRGWKTYHGGEYVTAGTRFLTPGVQRSTPVIKVRGNEHVREWALALIASQQARVIAVTDYARERVR